MRSEDLKKRATHVAARVITVNDAPLGVPMQRTHATTVEAKGTTAENAHQSKWKEIGPKTQQQDGWPTSLMSMREYKHEWRSII